MTQSQAEELKDLSVERIRKAADDGSLIHCPLLMAVLLGWEKVGGEEVRSWVNTVIRSDDVAVVRIAEAFTGVEFRSLSGDSVPERNYTAVTG